MFAIVLIAGLFSFLDTPMEKFEEQYYEETYKAQMAAIQEMELQSVKRISYALEDLEYEMKVKRRNESANESALDDYELKRLHVIGNQNESEMSAFDKQREALTKEHKRFRRELDARRAAFKLCGGKPSEKEARALEKFKEGKCKIWKLTVEEKNILHSWFMRGSAEWGRVMYKRGHHYIPKY